MGQHILDGTPPVPLILRKSARAKRISLRISQLDGRVTLTLPRGVSEARGNRFRARKSRLATRTSRQTRCRSGDRAWGVPAH